MTLLYSKVSIAMHNEYSVHNCRLDELQSNETVLKATKKLFTASSVVNTVTDFILAACLGLTLYNRSSRVTKGCVNPKFGSGLLDS